LYVVACSAITSLLSASRSSGGIVAWFSIKHHFLTPAGSCTTDCTRRYRLRRLTAQVLLNNIIEATQLFLHAGASRNATTAPPRHTASACFSKKWPKRAPCSGAFPTMNHNILITVELAGVILWVAERMLAVNSATPGAGACHSAHDELSQSTTSVFLTLTLSPLCSRSHPKAYSIPDGSARHGHARIRYFDCASVLHRALK
jgi:hypothetical protein